MRVADIVRCIDFPCTDVQHQGYRVPGIEVDPQRVRVILISEAASAQASDDYYSPGEALFLQTTLLAFNDAGTAAHSLADLLELGVYLTTAVKCAKTGYGIQPGTVKTCSRLLEAELNLFPNAAAYLLMGDVAIKAVNEIARRSGEARVIPAGATYKIRGGSFYFRGARAFPSYLQAGPSFFIEKSKRRMIAEDIRAALRAAEG
jgi:uracil-DNA glycosylase